MSRQLHDSLKRVEEFEVAMSEEKEEWHDNQRSITAAGIEQEMVEVLVPPMLFFNHITHVYSGLSSLNICPHLCWAHDSFNRTIEILKDSEEVSLGKTKEQDYTCKRGGSCTAGIPTLSVL